MYLIIMLRHLLLTISENTTKDLSSLVESQKLTKDNIIMH